ncbi:aspartic proteinase NANA, chloroplast-like [Andrographis paniculata]|uniref:aspartic proteinase NANA, chloroplast-like n=1 Tax=Andrographis paniculata TaxID=175694 RepID=UPI0021E810DE|nr:aspartic proteinase NANA, chloroplast-like [Andrographis paniculata]
MLLSSVISNMALSGRPSLPSLFLLILFLVPLNYANSGGIKFDLIHRNHLERNSLHGGPQLSRLSRLIAGDVVRLRAISDRQSSRFINNGGFRRRVQERRTDRPNCSDGGRSSSNRRHDVAGVLPMNSAADYGVGQYLVRFMVGSPPQKFALIADTGSDLTWMNCNYRCRGLGPRPACRRRMRAGVFQADRSASFRTLPCSSSQCKIDLAGMFSLSQCPSPAAPCAYDYRYSDGSAAAGIFANETITFTLSDRRRTKLRNVLVGCTQTAGGQSFVAGDGVLGLGYSNYSVAVAAARRFGGKFSYCLVDHLSPKNISSYLVFGSPESSAAAVSVRKLRYTRLVLGAIPPFYTVNLRGISIGASMLGIPPETWNLNGVGGVILDSGMSLTALTLPAYRPVMSALKRSLAVYRRLDLDIGPLEYCFNSTGFDESAVPRVAFHFAGGARFEPPVKSYVIDAAAGVKCLGFVAAAWPGASVIGNIMQQNNLWEIDLVNGRLGFGASSCT